MARDSIPQMPTPGRPISADWGRELVRCLRSFRPLQGVGTLLSRTPNGTTVTAAAVQKVSGAAPASLEPFTVRWHSHGKDKDGAWEVYLPWGCASVGGTACIPVNDGATDADGESEIGWYAFKIETADSVETKRVGKKIYRSFPVYALMKPWPHLKVSTAMKDWEEDVWRSRRIIANAQIAEWTSASGKKKVSHRVDQIFTGAWSETDATDPRSLFALTYKPSGDASNPETEWKPYLTNMTVTCGRFQVEKDGEVEIDTDSEFVVLKINHATDGEYSLEIQDSEDESTDTATYITLYALKEGVITSDTRTNITTMPFYDV